MSQQTERLGQAMAVIAALGILVVLTLLFNEEIAERRNPNRSVESLMVAEGTATIALRSNVMGHYVANGYINGHPVEFLIDTGATAVALSPATARHAGLVPGRMRPVVTANGTAESYDTRIDALDLGGIRMHNIDASITPGMFDEQVLLGMSFLADLEFAQKDGVLRITGPAR